MQGQRVERAQLRRADQRRSLTPRFEGPTVAFDAEDVRLLAGRRQDVETQRVAGKGLQQRRRRVAMDGTGKDTRGVRVARQARRQRLGPIVDADRALDLLGVGHLRGADHLVLVLDQEHEVAIAGGTRYGHVRAPARP